MKNIDESNMKNKNSAWTDSDTKKVIDLSNKIIRVLDGNDHQYVVGTLAVVLAETSISASGSDGYEDYLRYVVNLAFENVKANHLQ